MKTFTALLFAIMLLLPIGARAMEMYHKLPTVVLEMWDKDGIFHSVIIEMSVVFDEQPKLAKTVTLKIQKVLQALPYEELTRGNPAATIKTLALQAVRGEPGGENAREVLIGKLMFR